MAEKSATMKLGASAADPALTKYMRWLSGFLAWENKGIKMTRNGERRLFKAEPTGKFWTEWRANADDLRAAGISVSKDEAGNYEVCWWVHPNFALAHEKKVEIAANPIAPVTLRNTASLLSYQPEHVGRLLFALKTYKVAIDGSETGVGKTSAAMAVCRELQLRPIVLCSKAGIGTWHRWAREIGVEPEAVHNYEWYKTGKTPYMKLEKDGRKKKKKVIWTIPRGCILIFDEVHRCRGMKSENSEMLVSAKEQKVPMLLLSATPAESPLQMRALGYALGLFPAVSDFYRWSEGYGCRQVVFGQRFRVRDARANRRFYEFTTTPSEQREHMQKLHAAVFGTGRGARLTIAELGDAFPDNQVVAEPYSMGSSKEIQRIYDRLKNDLEALKEQAKAASEKLTLILRARQEVELLKVPTLVELCRDYIEEGLSVAIFVNFQKTVDHIAEALETEDVIVGGQTQTVRQNIVDRFQRNEAHVLVANIKAGGESISLHDVTGERPRVSIILPTWSATELKQALGRIHRSGGKSKARQRIIFAADTIEESVCSAVQRKLNNLAVLNDGDLTKALDLGV